jgi:hypothetical protein
MRLTLQTLSALLCVLLARPACADDKPAAGDETPVYTDEDWGFSLTHRGLEEPQPEKSITAFRAEVDGEKAGSFTVSRQEEKTTSKEYTGETLKKLATLFKGVVEDTVETELAGQKAWTSRMVSGGEFPFRYVLVCGDAKAGEPFWSIFWQGKSKQTDDHEKLVNSAITTFKLHKESEAPKAEPDLHYCQRLGFSVVTAGFKGKVEMLRAVGLASASHKQKTEDGKQPVGSILIRLANYGANRKDGIDAFKSERARFEHNVEVQEVQISGREAARVTSRFGVSSFDFKEKRERLLIWDGELVWEILVRYPNDAEELPAELGEALNSFKLLKPVPEESK